MMRLLFFISLLFLLLVGCERSISQATANAGPIESASTDDGRAEIFVYANASEITTLDQLVIRLELFRDIGFEANLVEPQWTSFGWTLIRVDRQPEELIDGRLRSEYTVTLEPFLEGEYAIPSVVVKTSMGLIQTQPVVVVVGSVLASSDSGELAPSEGFRIPSDPSVSLVGPIIAVIAGCGVLVSLGLVWWHGRACEKPNLTPTDQLQMVMDGQYRDNDEALACVHRAIETMGDHVEELQTVRLACERLRYSPAVEPVADAKQLAAQALDIVGRES